MRSTSLTAQEVQQLFTSTLAVSRSADFFIAAGEVLLQRNGAGAPPQAAAGKRAGRDCVTPRAAPAHAEPLMAEDILYNGSKVYPTNVRLRQLHGLALAQGGSTERAIELLETLRKDVGSAFDDESGGLLARCYKDMAARQKQSELRADYLYKAHAIYREAYERSGRTSYYTGEGGMCRALRWAAQATHASARTVVHHRRHQHGHHGPAAGPAQ